MFKKSFATLALCLPRLAAAWEPTKPVERVVPAGTGGGADQMARFIQGVVAKNNLMKQPIVVVNKSGGARAEGFLDVKGDKGNPHKIIITLSNLFTTPLATGVPLQLAHLRNRQSDSIRISGGVGRNVDALPVLALVMLLWPLWGVGKNLVRQLGEKGAAA